MLYLAGFGILIFLGLGSLFLFESRTVAIKTSSNIFEIFTASKSPESLDIKRPRPLSKPPENVKAVYVTSWTAATPSKIERIFSLLKDTELNAVVIDVKDYSGFVFFETGVPEVGKYKAEKAIIKNLDELVNRFHDSGVYVIARITVFQDPVLAHARPDLAIHNKSRLTLKPNTKNLTSETLWLDRKKLVWIDPAAKEAWDYNIAVAKEAAKKGFDEINFDYIRFPSDGNLDDMIFPFWDEKAPKSEVIGGFFKYLREQLAGVKISADIFGLTTVVADDLGIGQTIEDAYESFDFVSPMIYPSHFARGVFGFKNPAAYPYETVKYSMESAINRLIAKDKEQSVNNQTSTVTSAAISDLQFAFSSKLRPWLQDFDLGANYNAAMVRKQIQAVYDAASSTPETVNGWMLWDPSNVYTKEALNYE